MSAAPNDRVSLAEALLLAGNFEQARAALQRILQARPNDPRANFAMSSALSRLGQDEAAVYFAERAAQALPGNADAAGNAAACFLRTSSFEKARQWGVKAVALAPQSHHFRHVLGTALQHLGRHGEAIEACSVDGRVPVEHAGLSSLAASSLAVVGRGREAFDLIDRACATHPADDTLASSRCMLSLYLHDCPPERIAAAHRDYGRRVRALAGERPRPKPLGGPDKRLRLAFVSPDLRRHPVGYFLSPLLRHFDRERFEVIVYDTSGAKAADDVAKALRANAARTAEIGTISWEAFAAKVREDGVDVLLDLSGHTLSHSLPMLAWSPAPVVGTYLGYPFSTGMDCVDFRLVDTTTDPAGPSDTLASERLVRIDPCFLCYELRPELPPVGALPCAGGSPVTFASFNALPKINPRVLGLWRRVLEEVPGSRMLIKAMTISDAEARRGLERLIAEAGLSDRVEILGHQKTYADHLAAYGRIDVALDTFPYNGTTTTCEALAMGVPVVTLQGETHASRVGGSLLAAAGLGELVASGTDEFVRIARELAQDRRRLGELRSGLRDRLAASVVCDAPGFTRRFEAAIREQWVRALASA